MTQQLENLANLYTTAKLLRTFKTTHLKNKQCNEQNRIVAYLWINRFVLTYLYHTKSCSDAFAETK